MPIKHSKWKHLQELKKKISVEVHDFYNNLPFRTETNKNNMTEKKTAKNNTEQTPKETSIFREIKKNVYPKRKKHKKRMGELKSPLAAKNKYLST